MASKLDQLTKAAPNRALKKINLEPVKKEEKVEVIEEPVEIAAPVQPEVAPEPIAEEKTERPSIKRTPNKTMLSEIGNVTVEEKDNQIVTKEAPKAKNTKTKTKAESTESFTIRILEKEDQEFLKRGCRVCGYKSMQDFFIALVEEDSKIKDIDFKDEHHAFIFNSDKRFFTSTARISPELKNTIKTQAAKHRMYDGEYTAYLIHKKRMSTDGWC